MLITFSRLLHPLRSPRLIATRILSSFGKKPRIPPRKTKAVTKDRASLLSNPPIAPSTSQLLEDFLTPPGRSKSQENAEDKKDYLEKSARPRITRKKPLNDDTTPAPRDISQAQSQDVIKSVDLLRDFLNAEVQPPKRSARAHARTIHGPSRVRRTEMLPPPAKLDLFDQETFSNLSSEEPSYRNEVFCQIDSLEASTNRARSTLSKFEELTQWTLDGRLWRYPIDNEQDWFEELNTPFNEHVFLNRFVSKTVGSKGPGPLRAFMELVCTGLAQNPYIGAQQKKDHIAWFESYFNDKIKHIAAAVEEERQMVEAESGASKTKL